MFHHNLSESKLILNECIYKLNAYFTNEKIVFRKNICRKYKTKIAVEFQSIWAKNPRNKEQMYIGIYTKQVKGIINYFADNAIYFKIQSVAVAASFVVNYNYFGSIFYTILFL